MIYKLALIFFIAVAPQLGFAEEDPVESERLIAVARQSVQQPASAVLVADTLSDQGAESLAIEDDGASKPDDNSWTQHGLLVTHDGLDLAIHGQGFFWMINPVTGELRVTRNGILKVDTTSVKFAGTVASAAATS
jgi:flagellar basal body rod protein FlgF